MTTARDTYWRSLGELQQTPEFRQFLEREFPVAASEFPEGISRRRWMQLMGASLALSGLVGCRWEQEKFAPFAVRPENRVPGIPEYFATSIDIGGMPRHLLVTCYDGRPIKVEGNAQHPLSGGGSDIFSQASILNLYDPDRSSTLRQREGRQRFSRSWDEFATFVSAHFGRFRRQRGRGLALLLEPSSSVTRCRMVAQFQEHFPQATLYSAPSPTEQNSLAGSQLTFGQPLRALYDLRKADVIVCLDADLLGIHSHALVHARDFADRRNPDEPMNRLYAIESQFSVTGAAADHRFPLLSHRIGLMLAHIDRLVRAEFESTEARDLEALPDELQLVARAIAADLLAHRGGSVIAVGSGQPAEVHAMAFDLNATLGNLGVSVLLNDAPARVVPRKTQPLVELVEAAGQGQIETLLILGGNPAFDAPGDLKFAERLQAIPTTIHLAAYEDETSRLCTWHLPQSHPFKSWGDVCSGDGTLSVSQPLIDPLLNGKSQIELVAMLCNDRRESRALVRDAIGQVAGRSLSDDQWDKAVHDGFLLGSGSPPVVAQSRFAEHRQRVTAKITRAAAVSRELVFHASSPVLDGSYANNGWLQETPDFLTKLTWDNAAVISPGTARQLGIEHATIVRLTRNSRSIEIPAFVLPGQADGSIGIATGYGRTAAGVVGGDSSKQIPSVGVDVHPIRAHAAAAYTENFEIVLTGRKYQFATTQEHHAIDTVGLAETGRRVGELVREGTLDQYQHHPDFASHTGHHAPLESLWQEPSSEGHAWGMAIDLNKCIGCNACLVACQSENNVPIVGKDQVARGREMHWIRIDRYFQGEIENPSVAMQPVACHHCENAPCEQVCPVAATVHSQEGLNDMVYNRCIGTRYCANNCPYKVRRFNFFDYNKSLEEANRQLAQLAINPEVTVRSRGVMEKCTYCVQRIQSVKIQAKNDRRGIRDGEIKTACQQACPSQAIEFGDLNDPGSRVAQAHANQRAYGMLSELNVKPRTLYLARIRNPNRALLSSETNHLS